MKIPYWIEIIYTLPNSPRGLVIRAEKLIRDAEKETPKLSRNMRLYAKVLTELASKNWSPRKNREWIKENLRDGKAAHEMI